MPIPWDADPPSGYSLIAGNAADVARTIAAQAQTRVTPSLSLAYDWHRSIYRGVPLPVPYYAGEIRDSDASFPELIGYDVVVGSLPGVPHGDVPAALTAFEAGLGTVCSRLDAAIPAGSPPRSSATLTAVVRLAAQAHGEWVRIHPFANGNGRTARCWANFVSLRYGLPAIATIKPRPADVLYGQAARASMLGNHGPTEALFGAMLIGALPGP
jgi:fido (protein-threonine AMPylation protein)